MRRLTRVLTHVVHHVLLAREEFLAVLTAIWRITGVTSNVILKVLFASKTLGTLRTRVRLVGGVSLDMPL